jgi:organic radical activating enzyme
MLLVNKNQNKENTTCALQIFSTVQGEGVDSGVPAIFVRFQGCSVHCFFCDEKDTWVKRENNSLDVNEEDIFQEIQKLNKKIKRVVLTGGEPTEQSLKRLVNLLIANGYVVSIETAGTGEFLTELFQDYPKVTLSHATGFKRVFNFTFSPKEIYSRSKIADERIWQYCDELKFVLANSEAKEYLLDKILPKLKANNNTCPVYLTPDWFNFEVTKEMILKILAEYIGEYPQLRLGVQAHKYLDMP